MISHALRDETSHSVAGLARAWIAAMAVRPGVHAPERFPIGANRKALQVSRFWPRMGPVLQCRCRSPSVDGNVAAAGKGTAAGGSFFCGPLTATLDDRSVGFSTRRDDPSNTEFSSIDSDR